MESVAKSARVTRLTVYNHFGSRRALLEAVFDDRAASGGLHRIPEAMVEPDPHAALNRLIAIFSEFWSFDRGAITRLNRAGTRMLTAVLNRLFAARVTDPIAGFREVRRASLAPCTLRAVRYDIEVDVLLALLARGQRVVEVPVRRSPRRHGATGLSPLSDGTRILVRILARRLAG